MVGNLTASKSDKKKIQFFFPEWMVGNLPASKSDNIDFSKIDKSDNIDFSKIDKSDNIDFSKTDGNLPATKLDNIDMSKVATGNLYYNRIQDFHQIVHDRFLRIVRADSNTLLSAISTFFFYYQYFFF